MTQIELAEKAGILQSSLSHYETGRRKPPLDVAARIAAALGCTVDDLIAKEPA